jgi:hypothetical protein
MAAGFEGDIESRPGDRFRRIFYGVDLGMVLTAAAVVAFRDDPIVPDDDGADQRIRADAPLPLLGQPQRQTHETLIFRTGFSFSHDLLIACTVGMTTKNMSEEDRWFSCCDPFEKYAMEIKLIVVPKGEKI